MLGGFEPSLEFLNECVPLWFALVMGFTSPYLWSKYIKDAAKRAFKRVTLKRDDNEE
jgi:hypothetical protein